MKEKPHMWVMEAAFVIGMLLLLKKWVFPFLIWQWFGSGDSASNMLIGTHIAVAVVTAMVYVGLGSVSNQAYGLSLASVWGMGTLSHAVFFVPVLPWTAPLRESWTGLLGDGVHLFLPSIRLSSLETWLVCIGLLTIGRVLRVRDTEVEPKPARFPMAINSFSANKENRSWSKRM
ncbi:hypothetical protein [Polycladomyces subterraneus]|uniref:Uncharacterized protein n=1 Tax=Polycladomyces subterraneus TaxID=1016997 RepID=A0ABT8INY1_9BACL|nr:hypothetical protein [Polycladomyces subterraneus]MDN4594241.1 hypothetical protein [Polycladomyces subterraneus]